MTAKSALQQIYTNKKLKITEKVPINLQTKHKHIAQILNQIAETGYKPLELSLGQLIPLPKPGKLFL